MEIVEIYAPWIYSIQFDENDLNEYDRLIAKWHDVDYLQDFFSKNSSYLDNPVWQAIGLSADDPEGAVERVVDEADNLAEYVYQLAINADNGDKPDFEDFFKLLGGKYSLIFEMEPVKAYGTAKPSLLRLYAIKFEENSYLVVCGGIKLSAAIQDSPELKDNVLQKIDKVLSFLKREGITSKEDI